MEFVDMIKEAVAHQVAQSVRAAVRISMPPEADGMQIWEVCQWPERRQECVYIVQPGEAIIRIRIDVIDTDTTEKALEFFKGEPGIDVKTIEIEIPDNVAELFPKE